MNTLSFVWLWAVYLGASSMEGQADDVINADRLLNRYITEHNIQGASNLYADDFVLTTSSGAVKKKQDMLKDIGLPDLHFEINETMNVQIRRIENTAVLTGTLHQKGLYKEKLFDNKLLVTDTWVNLNGQWKLLAGHATLLK